MKSKKIGYGEVSKELIIFSKRPRIARAFTDEAKEAKECCIYLFTWDWWQARMGHQLIG